MAKPRLFANFTIKELSRNRNIPVFEGEVKKGKKYSFEVVPPLGGTNDGDALAMDIYQLSEVKDTLYIDGKMEVFLNDGIDWRTNKVGSKIEEIFQKVYDDRVKPSLMPQSTQTQQSQQTAIPSEQVANGNDIQQMQNIDVESIINRLAWRAQLKISMTQDFEDSGYPYFGGLVKQTIKETSQAIQDRINGFSSGKNTYLQANQIAEELFNFYFGIRTNVTSQVAAPKISVSKQPNTGNNIYGIVTKGAYIGELIQIVNIVPFQNNSLEEKDYNYEVVLNGNNGFLPRNNFMVEGDIVELTLYKITDTVPKLKITNIESFGLVESINLNTNEETSFNIVNLGWADTEVKTIEYYNLHEIFDSKAMSETTKKPAPTQPKKLNEDEERIDKLNREINELIVIKGSLQPFDLEDIIEIEQKIDEKQKNVNEITVQIVDKKLSNNKIFDDLFEQSFLPIQSRYEDIFVIDAPLNSGNFFAPNGTPSKLNDSLNIFIRTPLFKDWFGDWQLSYQYRDIPNSGIYCSKVVSDNFEPRVVWHGTGREFSYFRFDNFPAAYFAVNKDYSDFFANIQSREGEEGYVIPFFLNLRKPLDLTKFTTREVAPKDFFDFIFLETGMTTEFLEVNPIFLDPKTPPVQVWVYIRNNPKMLLKLSESHVYDGIHFYESNPNVPSGQSAHVTEAYITFKPESCKIADPKRGDIVLASMKSFLLEKGGKI